MGMGVGAGVGVGVESNGCVTAGSKLPCGMIHVIVSVNGVSDAGMGAVGVGCVTAGSEFICGTIHVESTQATSWSKERACVAAFVPSLPTNLCTVLLNATMNSCHVEKPLA